MDPLEYTFYNSMIGPFLKPDDELDDCDVCEKPVPEFIAAAHICAAIDRLVAVIANRT
jgi:hypothetical protein